MKKWSKKATILLIIAALFLAAGLVYYRPLTLPQLYPALSPDRCTEIRCTSFDIEESEFIDITIDRDSEAFQPLCALFYDRTYHRARLNREFKDLLTFGVQRGSAKETNWYVFFLFDDIDLPDGTAGDDVVLRFDYWFGDFDIYFDGEFFACQTSNHETWATEILNIIHGE